jgi:D-3-phosphoglycerate dehydrogenase
MRAVKIEVMHKLPDWFAGRMASVGIEHVVIECRTPDDLEAAAAGAEIVWLFSGMELLMGDCLSRIPNCGLILRVGSGTDNVDVARATELGIVVANTGNTMVENVCDHTVALLFSLIRNVPRHDRAVRAGRWEPDNPKPLKRMSRATIGFVGFGRIAQLVAARLAAFGPRFVAFDPYADAGTFQKSGVERTGLEELLSRADYVSLHCPYTAETDQLIGAGELAIMQPHAALINMARGKVVDQAALVAALQTGSIAAAALDVFEHEPLPAESPLTQLDNVILSPHVGGHSAQFPEEHYEAAFEIFAALVAGKWPRSVVNPAVQPRWEKLAKARE